ncbi:MAG TPA: hypothetical protein ENN03_06240 [bacterium]|nr:hypothetical protein [bacterium]
MTNCHSMKKGEVYICEECGLELEVVKECRDSGKPAESCGCHDHGDPCSLSCCGCELRKK